jgi:hypothetical protein
LGSRIELYTILTGTSVSHIGSTPQQFSNHHLLSPLCFTTSISNMVYANYPFAAVDVTGLPVAVEDNVPDRIRQDLFNKLHWDVFGPLSDITVQDINKNTLAPFASHAIGLESIADPPVSRISVNIDVCQQKFSMDETDEEEYRYQPPEPLLIENQNGSPILIKDFINQVHLFLNTNKTEIYKCEDENYYGADEDEGKDKDRPTECGFFMRSGNIPTGSRFFFDRTQFNELDTDEFEVYVELFVEGNMGMSSDQFWEHRATV